VFTTSSGYARPVKEPVGLLIAAARRRMKRAVQDRVAPHGLTPQQFWVLVNIDEAEGPSLGEIAAREGDPAGAEAFYRDALQIAQQTGARDEMVETERRLAELDLLQAELGAKQLSLDLRAQVAGFVAGFASRALQHFFRLLKSNEMVLDTVLLQQAVISPWRAGSMRHNVVIRASL